MTCCVGRKAQGGWSFMKDFYQRSSDTITMMMQALITGQMLLTAM